MTDTRRALATHTGCVAAATLAVGPVGLVVAGAGILWVRQGTGSRDRVLAVVALLLLATGTGWLSAGAPSDLAVGAFTTLVNRDWLDALGRGVIALLLVAAVAPTEPVHADQAWAKTQQIGGARTPLPEVDRLRAIAIVVVVLIHGLPFAPPVTAYLDLWLSDILRFAVPTLLFVSGWLAPRTRVGWSWLGRRAARILPAYLVASVIVLALSRVSPLLDPRPIVEALLTASAIGPYYYVAVLVVLTALTPLLLRLTPRTRWSVLVIAAIVALGIEVADPPLRVRQYLTLTWLPYYLAGMQLRPLRSRIAAVGELGRGLALTTTGVLVVAVAFVPINTHLRLGLSALTIWGVLGTLLLITLAAGPTQHPLTRTLSQRSYLIYLYHAPVVAGLAGAFGSPAVTLRPFVATAVALVTCLAAAQLARFAWPRGAGRWLGA